MVHVGGYLQNMHKGKRDGKQVSAGSEGKYEGIHKATFIKWVVILI